MSASSVRFSPEVGFCRSPSPHRGSAPSVWFMRSQEVGWLVRGWRHVVLATLLRPTPGCRPRPAQLVHGRNGTSCWPVQRACEIPLDYIAPSRPLSCRCVLCRLLRVPRPDCAPAVRCAATAPPPLALLLAPAPARSCIVPRSSTRRLRRPRQQMLSQTCRSAACRPRSRSPCQRRRLSSRSLRPFLPTTMPSASSWCVTWDAWGSWPGPAGQQALIGSVERNAQLAHTVAAACGATHAVRLLQVGQSMGVTVVSLPLQHWSVDMWRTFYPSKWLESIGDQSAPVPGVWRAATAKVQECWCLWGAGRGEGASGSVHEAGQGTYVLKRHGADVAGPRPLRAARAA